MGLTTADARKPAEKTALHTFVGTIVSANETSGQAPYEGADWRAWDNTLGLLVKYRGPGWYFRQYYGGDADIVDGVLKGWGRGGWQVARYCEEMGIRFGEDGVPETNETAPYLPSIVVERLVGKKVAMLRYVSGINSEYTVLHYSYYKHPVWIIDNVPGAREDALRRVAEHFHEARTRGYPPNYQPELVDVFNQLHQGSAAGGHRSGKAHTTSETNTPAEHPAGS